jgi:hypothetical protein
MKIIKSFKVFESSELNKKFLITMSTANSGGINDDLTLKDPSQARHWSIGFPKEIEITDFIKKLGNKSNDTYTKIISALTDMVQFGGSNSTEIDHINDKELNRLINDLEIIYDNSGMVDSVLHYKIKNKFKKLSVDKKLEFYKYLLEIGFLIERGSYIYKVVDEAEITGLFDQLITKLDDLNK